MKIHIPILVSVILLSACKNDDEPVYDVMYRVKGTSRYHRITYQDSSGNMVVKDSVRDHWEYGFFSRKDQPVSLEAQNLDTTGTITAVLSVNGAVIDTKTDYTPRGSVKVQGTAK